MMAKSGKRRQYGWHMYKGLTQIIFTAGSAIQLVHGKRYQVAFDERKSGKCTAVVSDGFINKRFNYPNREEFESDWARPHCEPIFEEVTE